MSVNACYPERKIFQIEQKDTWIFGQLNTCKFDSSQGSQIFGVCCTRYTPQIPKQESNEVDRKAPFERNIASRKCSPAPISAACSFNGRRIVNGQQSSRNSYPFMVSLQKIKYEIAY